MLLPIVIKDKQKVGGFRRVEADPANITLPVLLPDSLWILSASKVKREAEIDKITMSVPWKSVILQPTYNEGRELRVSER